MEKSTHPTKKHIPPIGVMGPSIFGFIPLSSEVLNKYNEPENKTMPVTKKR